MVIKQPRIMYSMFGGLSDLFSSAFVASKWLATLAALSLVAYSTNLSFQSGFSYHFTISSILLLTGFKFCWLIIQKSEFARLAAVWPIAAFPLRTGKPFPSIP